MPVVLHAESMRLGPGGQTIRLIEEARRLNQRHDWTCYVAGLMGGPLENDLAGEPWFVPFDFRSFRLHPAAIRQATRIIRRISPDVVHTHSSQDAWIFGLAARICRVPVVRGRHASHPIPGSRLKRLVYTHLADAFTVSGSTIGRLLTDAGVASKDQVFNTGGGFDPTRFCRDNRDRDYLRRELQLPEEATILGAACTVRPTKGVDTLVEAFIRLQPTIAHNNVHLVVAGEVSDRDRDELASRLPGQIHLLGFRTDVEKVLGGMDVLVVPSKRADGIPQVIPQAMALGVPVIGTRAGGIPDAIEHGQTGFLVDAEDTDQLARMMRHVIAKESDQLQMILNQAESHALQTYTFDRVVETYSRAYEHVLGRTTHRVPSRAA